jgi:hypothetical protein
MVAHCYSTMHFKLFKHLDKSLVVPVAGSYSFSKYHADNHIDRAGKEPRPRRLQQVVTWSDKKAVVEWMTISEALEGQEGLVPITIVMFSEHFKGNYGANFIKASWWWADQDTLNLVDNANPSPLYTTCAHVGKLSKQSLKVSGGRGSKAQPWILRLYNRMNDKRFLTHSLYAL